MSITTPRLGIDTGSGADLSLAAMTLLHEAVDFKKMDTRVVERNIDRGVLNAKELEKALKDLPDDAENADFVSIDSLKSDDEGSSKSATH